MFCFSDYCDKRCAFVTWVRFREVTRKRIEGRGKDRKELDLEFQNCQRCASKRSGLYVVC